MIKFLLFTLMISSLTACLPPVGTNPQAGGEGAEEPQTPLAGVQVRVAYIHMNSISYDEMQDPAVKAQISELWSQYDSVYMYIEAGENLRYWDFGLLGIERGAPIRTWTTGDYNVSNQWNYLISNPTVIEDNHAHDYSWNKNGFAGRFTKHPFAMHYRIESNTKVKFNVIGVHLDHSNFTSESIAMKEVFEEAQTKFWNSPDVIAFGNFTQNCKNSLDGLIVRNEDETCAEQSVVISPSLQKKVNSINTFKPAETEFNLLTTRPIIEVILDL